MLILNGKPIDLDGNSPVAKRIQKGMDELRKAYDRNKGKLNFIQNPERVKKMNNVRVVRGNVSTLMQSPVSVPMISKVVNEQGGTETWAYSDGIPFGDNDNLVPNPKSITIYGGDFPVSKERMELAYFLYFKSSLVKAGKIIVDDPHKREEQEAEMRKAEAQLNGAIYGDEMDSARLREVAPALILGGIDKLPDTKDDAAIRNILYRTCTSDPMKAAKLYELLGDADEIEYRNVVAKAIDKQIIGFDKIFMKWGYCDDDNKVVREIAIIQPAEVVRKEEVLIDYLKDNVKDFTELRKITAKGSKKLEMQSMTMDQFEEKLKPLKGAARTKFMKKICESYNIPVEDKSYKELYDEIVELLN